MAVFHQSLSDRTVELRYLGPRSLSYRIAHARLARLCFIDYDREMALVAVHEVPGGGREILGVARLYRIPNTTSAEFALVVSDRWQRRGLGTQLLRRLVEIARAVGWNQRRQRGARTAPVLESHEVRQEGAHGPGAGHERPKGDHAVDDQKLIARQLGPAIAPEKGA